ncbi:MAG: sigma 54-interacting transcriptional regulator [Opitutaceae bacterium]|nr:sigma 54-interacting transcriptional regulator [Opitutaceae bacterium]
MGIIQTDNAHILSSMLEGYDCPAILVSAQYEILACNKAYKQAFGQLEIKDKPNCYQVSHGYNVPCDQAGESCPLMAATASSKKERVLHIHQTSQGKEYVDVEMLPLLDDHGKLLFFIELLRPVPLASGKFVNQEMVGSSQTFLALLEKISLVGNSHASVLLLGESGTGKELAARAIHMSSSRKDKPMVTLECAGLTDSLFESELFGHIKGAFTGAHTNKPGLIELANGGTLFLDEIADIPLSMQIKLLRLLETGTYRAVGSTDVRTSNFRLITATHKNLLAMIEVGTFRQDLYYRLNVFPIHMPSLSERREDIPKIAKSLIWRINAKTHYQLTNSAVKLLKTINYKGNIRELRNILHRALILSDDNVIDDSIIKQCIAADSRPYSVTTVLGEPPIDLKTAERKYLQQLMEKFDDKEKVAKIAGISIRSLYRKLRPQTSHSGSALASD